VKQETLLGNTRITSPSSRKERIVYARIVTVHVQADKIDELIAVYRDSVVPAIKGQKGFLGARLFTDRATGKGISVTRWQTNEALEDGLYQAQLTKLAPFLTQPPERQMFEISVDESSDSSQ
jgi:hypothetical protein